MKKNKSLTLFLHEIKFSKLGILFVVKRPHVWPPHSPSGSLSGYPVLLNESGNHIKSKTKHLPGKVQKIINQRTKPH